MLELKHVTKHYGDFCAVDDLSFTVKEGTIVGLIGHNGAGKSTTFRMIMDIIRPDNGSILLDGKPFSAEDTDKIGYLPEERGLYKKEKISKTLCYLAALKSVSKQDALNRIDQWLERFDMKEWKDKTVENLSKGMAQKIQFISSVLHDPKIIFLDEPFTGLDPVSADELLKVILELKKEGRIIVFSTHVMEQAERICDHIIMLNHGKKLLDGSLADIKKQFGNNSLTVEFAPSEKAAPDAIDSVMKNTPNLQNLNISGNVCNAVIEENADASVVLAQMTKLAAEKNLVIVNFKINEPDLHSIFVNLAGGEE